MGALKNTAIHLVLISLYPVYATNLAENIDAQPTVKHIVYTTNERNEQETADPSPETQNFIEFKKQQKLAVRRSVSPYPRLVVVTSPINVPSSEPAEVEIESSPTGDEESDNSQSTNGDEFINVYAKELLNQNIDLMIPTTFVGFEKW